MAGTEILIAPIMQEGTKVRDLILPKGRWYSYESGKIYGGEAMIQSEGDIPIFQRENSVIIVNSKLYIFGKIEENIFFNGEWHRLKRSNEKPSLGDHVMKENEFII
ncbi:Glycoside hydrolase, family 31, partial [mine drainage metagenome]